MAHRTQEELLAFVKEVYPLKTSSEQGAIAEALYKQERKMVWMCSACGRFNSQRDKVGDESCFLNAVEVWEDSLIGIQGSCATGAVAVDDSRFW